MNTYMESVHFHTNDFYHQIYLVCEYVSAPYNIQTQT